MAKRNYPNDYYAWYNDDNRVAIVERVTSTDNTETHREAWDTFQSSGDLTGNITATGNISSSFTSTGSFGRVLSTTGKIGDVDINGVKSEEYKGKVNNKLDKLKALRKRNGR